MTQETLVLLCPICDAKSEKVASFTDAKRVCIRANENDASAYISWNERSMYWSLWIRYWPGGHRPDYYFICRLTQQVAFELVDKELADNRFEIIQKAEELHKKHEKLHKTASLRKSNP